MTTRLHTNTFKSITTHALAIALFTNPYFMYVLTDIYRYATNDTSASVINTSLITTMSVVSFTTLMLAGISFCIYMFKKR